jgi:uncharacterized protein YdhG (YjbR/CyaY superfamily)
MQWQGNSARTVIVSERGKEIENVTQDHTSDQLGPIDAYIAEQPEQVQPLLRQVHQALSAALPGAEERIAWRMPTYWREHNIIHFAAFKNHIGLYPGAEAIEHFSDRLAPYKTSKGAVQFRYTEPLPLDLIAEIAQWCYETGHHH